jgi:hypothetical protein
LNFVNRHKEGLYKVCIEFFLSWSNSECSQIMSITLDSYVFLKLNLSKNVNNQQFAPTF